MSLKSATAEMKRYASRRLFAGVVNGPRSKPNRIPAMEEVSLRQRQAKARFQRLAQEDPSQIVDMAKKQLDELHGAFAVLMHGVEDPEVNQAGQELSDLADQISRKLNDLDKAVWS